MVCQHASEGVHNGRTCIFHLMISRTTTFMVRGQTSIGEGRSLRYALSTDNGEGGIGRERTIPLGFDVALGRSPYADLLEGRSDLEWLEEMECPCLSNVEANTRHGFEYVPLEQLARELKKMDLVIPFGNRK